MKKERKKHPVVRIIVFCALAALVIAALVFTHFGGFGTGESASPEALANYAGTVEDIVVPEGVTVVALGEATHGNAEFQRLKLDVFKHLVERYNVRALALEGDYGGCEQVNRYIHGGAGTAREAAAAIGFAIYRTDEMAALISYMRDYNDTAAQGDDLRFYGFDMQRCLACIRFLAEACDGLGIDTKALTALADDENWSDAFDTAARIETITKVKDALISKGGSPEAIHFADSLLQNCQLQTVDAVGYGDLRDTLMAENIAWIADREREAGYTRIFVTAHNGHVARWGTNDMGKHLAEALGRQYYVIGTDFYKTRCNMPSGANGKRTVQTFYSYDPLAKAAKRAGLALCYVDFRKAAESPELAPYVSDYHYMGSLGEGYSLLMRLLPPSYRIFQPPATLYDGMIFVADASPTEILSAE